MEDFDSSSNKGSIMTHSRDRSSGSEVAERIAGKSSSGASGTAGGITWNALLDEYPLAGQSMALKVRYSYSTLWYLELSLLFIYLSQVLYIE